MLTVLQAAQHGSAHIYDPGFAWSAVIQGPDVAESRVGILHLDDDEADIIAFRGSTTPNDFLKDLTAALAVPEGPLGWVALGFMEDMRAIYARVLVALKPGHRRVVTGHSLGAAQAADFTAYCWSQGVPIDAVVLMGCPRPGLSNLAKLVRRTSAAYSFRNGLDPVCDVPPWAQEPLPFIELSEPRQAADAALAQWGPIVDQHHWQLYLRGIGKGPTCRR